MSRLLLLLLLLVSAGCQRSNGPDVLEPDSNRGSIEHFFTTGESRYAAGGKVVLTLRNTTQHAIGYNLCLAVLQQRSGTEWSRAPHQEGVCTMELRSLNAGGVATFPHTLDPRLPAGEYRFHTTIEHMPTGRREQVFTNAFAVTR